MGVDTANRQYIDHSAIRWPKFAGDLNVLVTEFPIYHVDTSTEPDPVPLRKDRAISSPTIGLALPARKIAIVDTQKSPDALSQATAHEIGHLLGVKKRGDKWDQVDHCTDAACLMATHADVSKEEIRIPKRGIDAFLERRGYRKAEYKTVDNRNVAACDECSEQIGQAVFWQRKRKAGEYVPAFLD